MISDRTVSWLAPVGAGALERAGIAAAFHDWAEVEHIERGTVAAVAVLKGCEIHFVVSPLWRGRLIRRANTRAFLAPLLAAAGGMLTTRILHSSHASADFVRRIGFVPTWRDALFTYFALTRAPFSRAPL